jgi:hypothetical protein
MFSKRRTALTRARLIVLGCLLVLLAACRSQLPSPQPYDSEAKPDPAEVRLLTTTTGGAYRYFDTGDPGGQKEPDDKGRDFEAERRALFDAELASGRFGTKDIVEVNRRSRGVAKTSIARTKPRFYPKLAELLGSLPRDSEMRQLNIDRETPRLEEEMRFVATCAWIVATRREDDGDYHMVLSNGAKMFMNAKISGIPDRGNKLELGVLITVRQVFEGFVEETARSPGNYKGWGDPVLVYVEGPLFYDIDHRPGSVGPKGARSKTSWEIHPVAHVDFESKKCR